MRQFAAGDLQGAVAQAHQLDDQSASDAYGDDEGGGDRGEAEEHGGSRRGEQCAGERVGPVGDPVAGVHLDAAHVVPHARVGGRPGRFGDGVEHLCSGVARDHLVFEGAQVGVGVPSGEFLPGRVLRAAQVRSGGFGQRAACVDGADEQAQPCAVEGLGEVGAGQERVLLCQRLGRAGELQQHARVGAEFGVLDAGERATHAEGRGDGRRVSLVRLRPAAAAVEDRRPQRTQVFGPGHEAGEAFGDPRGQVGAVGDGVAVAEAQGANRPVGAPRESAERLLPLRGGCGGVPYGGRALGLEGRDGVGDRAAHGGVDALQLTVTGDVLGGGDGGVGPQCEQGDDRHHQQTDDLGADGTGAQPTASRARGRAGRRGAGAVGREVLLGRWSGVGAAPAYRGSGRRLGGGCRGPAGCTHGLLDQGSGAGFGGRHAASGRRRSRAAAGPTRMPLAPRPSATVRRRRR